MGHFFGHFTAEKLLKRVSKTTACFGSVSFCILSREFSEASENECQASNCVVTRKTVRWTARPSVVRTTESCVSAPTPVRLPTATPECRVAGCLHCTAAAHLSEASPQLARPPHKFSYPQLHNSQLTQRCAEFGKKLAEFEIVSPVHSCATDTWPQESPLGPTPASFLLIPERILKPHSLSAQSAHPRSVPRPNSDAASVGVRCPYGTQLISALGSLP